MAGFEPNGLVTLTTDFGTFDGYVGAMKGVILSRFPTARVIDVTHDIPPQDVRAAARALQTAAPWFPEGTVHVAVVDPGVGTSRAAVVAVHGGSAWVAPDNGVLSQVVPEAASAWRVDRRDLMCAEVSRTFHGRDVFSPVAAVIASGEVAPEAVGAPHSLLRIPDPELHRGPGCLRGEVVAIDRFGNLISNVPLSALPRDVELSRVGIVAGDAHVKGVSWSYADVATGDWVVVIGSGDTLELSVRDGSAAARAGTRVGDPFRVNLPRGSH